MRLKRNTASQVMVDKFDEMSFWKKIREKAKDMGISMVYKVLQLYYAMVDKDTPIDAKLVIAGALAYLVLPVDLIPDFLPGGYADDLSAVVAALKIAEMYITERVKDRARAKIMDLFGVKIHDEPVLDEEESTDEQGR